MKPEEKGRFCNSCQKTVMDFRNMSDSQLAEFFKKPAGTVCGRFHADQLNRDITIPRKRIPWVKYFFQFSIPAFLFSMKSAAQGKVVLQEKAAGQSIKSAAARLNDKIIEEELRNDSIIVSGKVFDEVGTPIGGATIMIWGTTSGTVTKEDGSFRLLCKIGDRLIVNSVGYLTVEMKVTKASQNISLVQAQMEWMGLIVSYPVDEKRKEEIPLITKTTDSSKKVLNIFPNPVSSGQSIRIEVKQLEKGNYDVRVLAADASIIRSRNYQHQKENNWIEEGSVGLKTGSYYIQFINKQTGKVFTEKFIVQ